MGVLGGAGSRRRLAVAAGVVGLLAGCSGADDPAAVVATSPRASAAAAGGGDATASLDAPTGTAGDGVVQRFEDVPPLHPSVDGYASGFVDLEAGDGTVHRVAVRLATTSEERAHGLMEVEHLPEGAGMWFVYDQDRDGPFWMKNTLVPLDIAYVGSDDRIVSIADAVPCTSEPCPTYAPGGPYRNVLEVPNGWLASIGVGEGDRARLVTP